jgi:hypothetical protein
MPGADQAAVFVDAAGCEVGTQVAALATDSEVVAVDADGVLFDSGEGAFGDARGGDGMTLIRALMGQNPTVVVRIGLRPGHDVTNDLARESGQTSG